MTHSPNREPVIDMRGLTRRFGKTVAVDNLDLTVQPGRCYGLFGRNGAGKTTALRCLLNLLQPTSGTVRLFGQDPALDDVSVKSRFCYVPDTVGCYPWMTALQWFEYIASFRGRWNQELQKELLAQFQIRPDQKVVTMSKGQQMQVALIAALCPEPELLILDEPTAGLDPLIRREFIQTIIGAYQDGAPENRTILVSTHMLTEFEGLIDEFTILDHGRQHLSLSTDEARERYQRVRARFSDATGDLDDLPGLQAKAQGRELSIVSDGNLNELRSTLESRGAEVFAIEPLTLEELFIAASTKQTLSI